MIIEQLILDKPSNKKTFATDSKSEKPKRSIVKSISWRIVGTVDTVLISWMVTGTLAVAFSIGTVELFTKMILYFFHERLWNTINWGK